MYKMLMNAKKAAPALSCLTNEMRSAALQSMASALLRSADDILCANRADMEAARAHISEVMLDRLALDRQRIEAMAKGILSVAELPDPVGTVLEKTNHKNGLVIDHITPGNGMKIYHFLGLDELDCQVAIIKNCDSAKMGKKETE